MFTKIAGNINIWREFMKKKAVIFGAGKIARGFIGQLLYLSDFEITFVDVF